MNPIIIAIILAIVVSGAYVLVHFLQEKKSYGAIVGIGAILLFVVLGVLFKKGFLFQNPDLEDSDFTVALAMLLIMEGFAGYYRQYFKKTASHDLTELLLKPLLLQLGCMGLVLPYLNAVEELSKGFNLVIIGSNPAIVVTVVLMVLLKTITGGYAGGSARRVLKDLFIWFVGGMLIVSTRFVWWTVGAELFYGLIVLKKSVKIHTATE